MIQKIILFSIFCLLSFWTSGQTQPTTNVNVNGKLYPAVITPEGDTLLLMEIEEVSITSPESFGSDEDYQKYLRMKRYASQVYPYAKEAIRIFRESEFASKELSKKEKKRRLKELDEELTKEFEQPLKGLTKLQGKILIKMIEKELKSTMYELVKQVKGGFTAFYWNSFSKLYSYDLKEGYVEGSYPLLDAVLKDFDLTHSIEDGKAMKYFNIEEIRNKKKKQ
jgi:hypothetical protein